MGRLASIGTATIASLVALAAASGGPAAAKSPAPPPLSVLSYNVKGLPWPLTSGRSEAFARIEARLRAMRAHGVQPHVIVLQEAFSADAKAIARQSGYRYIVEGPSRDLLSPDRPRRADAPFIRAASFFKGERSGKQVDSGLMLGSDYPILSVRRAAFPAFACAGFDCLANKGILLATIRVPGYREPVTVATTHMNSKKSSGVGTARSLYAYERQVDAIDRFLAKYRNPELPIIFAGDFNASSAARRAYLARHSLAFWKAAKGMPLANALQYCLAPGKPCGRAAPAIAAWVFARGRDWQFYTPGLRASVQAISMIVPFGRERDGTMLSDHVGYGVAYRLSAAAGASAARAPLRLALASPIQPRR